MKKKMLSWILCLVVVLSGLSPAFGEGPQVSQWAIEVLNEGETYGIYPQGWYYDGFLDQISQERFDSLLNHVSNKLDSAGLEKDSNFEPFAVSELLTRGEVVKGLYNVLGHYGLTTEKDPVKALADLQVLKGTGTSLALDAPCTLEQATVMAIRLVNQVYTLNSLGTKGLLWEVKHGETTVYLLGSIHLGTTELYPLHTRIIDALDASDALWVEANVLNQQQGMAEFYEIAKLPEGETLEVQLGEVLYKKLLLALEVTGVPIEALSIFKPWLISNELSALMMQQGINQGADLTDSEAIATTTRGLDVYFILRAMLSGKPIAELEGVVAQAKMFDGLSDEVVATQLESVLDMILEEKSDEQSSAEQMNELISSWFAFWAAGDVEGFSESFAASQDSEGEFTQMLFGARDEYMAQRIHELLVSEHATTHFVVVGAGHLVGDLSIIKNLKAMGYEVHQK